MKKLDLLLGLFFVGAVSIANAQTYTSTTYTGGTPGPATTATIATAEYKSPERLTYDNDGNIILVDRGNHTIRKINMTTGAVTTIAGSGTAGYTDAVGTSAQFNNPWGATVDAVGNIYVADRDNNRIRKIATDGTVSTYAGNGTSETVNNDNPLLASFVQPLDLVFDKDKNLLVADGSSNLIRAIAPDGKVTTYAGDGSNGTYPNVIDNDNPLLAAFNDPSGLGRDAAGNIYVADRYTHRIRKIDLTRKVTTVAGSGVYGNADNADPMQAQFYQPYDVDVDADGNIFVVELYHDVRKIASTGEVTTIAGLPGTSGNAVGSGGDTRFKNPSGLAIAPNGIIYVVEVSNNKIKALTPSTLPVNLTSFTGKLNGADGVALSWSTASEQNNDYFELLRSDDGITWSIIKTIKGKGNSTQVSTYGYIDPSPLAGTNYYLLKQVDFDGSSTSFKAVSVNYKLSTAGYLNAYYNNGNLTISTKGDAITKGTLNIHNLNGQVLLSKTISLNAGAHDVSLPLSLKTGLYILSISSEEGSRVVKFIAE